MPECLKPERLKVVAAVIYNPVGEILIARRPEKAHQGGLWEFPGGKLEVGENYAVALKRELIEELGITIHTYEPWMKVSHDYSDKKVLLDVWKVTGFRGMATGKEGQQIRWCALGALKDYAFPAANEAIIAGLWRDDLNQIS